MKKIIATLCALTLSAHAYALETTVVNTVGAQSALLSTLSKKIEQLQIELDAKVTDAKNTATAADAVVLNNSKSYTNSEIAKVKARISLIENCNRQGKLYNTSSKSCVAVSSKPKFVTKSAKGSAHRWGKAKVSCPSSYVMIGGGGGCSTPVGYNRMPYNGPSGNGWLIQCDTDKKVTSTATVHVRCMLP